MPCGDRRLQRESARTAPIGERRHRGRAQGAAGQHGGDGAVARPLWVVAMSTAFGERGASRSDSQCPVRMPIDLRALPARDAGGPFRRQQPVVGAGDQGSDQLSACPSVTPSGGTPPPATPRRAENRKGARRSPAGDRRRYALRHHTDSSGAFACRAATVASRVNAPEKRPSLGATIAEGRRAQPGGTAR